MAYGLWHASCFNNKNRSYPVHANVVRTHALNCVAHTQNCAYSLPSKCGQECREVRYGAHALVEEPRAGRANHVVCVISRGSSLAPWSRPVAGARWTPGRCGH